MRAVRREQAPAFTADDLAAVLATCHRPRTFARGRESPGTAARRGLLDAAIAGLLFMAALRRSEVAALRWSDLTDTGDAAGGILIRVRTSKTNPAGDDPDVRYVKAGVGRALRSLRNITTPEPSDRVVPLTPRAIGRRFTAAARAAGALVAWLSQDQLDRVIDLQVGKRVGPPGLPAGPIELVQVVT